MVEVLYCHHLSQRHQYTMSQIYSIRVVLLLRCSVAHYVRLVAIVLTA